MLRVAVHLTGGRCWSGPARSVEQNALELKVQGIPDPTVHGHEIELVFRIPDVVHLIVQGA